MRNFRTENNTISINGVDIGKVISLTVEVDGEVSLNIGSTSFNAVKQEVVEFQEGDFLKVQPFKGDDSAILFPITYDKKIEVLDFFKLFNVDALEDLKKSRWEEFVRCWKVVLDCVKESIDLDKYEVTYKLEPNDLRDCGGGFNMWLDIFVTRGISWDDDFEWSQDLNNTMFDAMFKNKVFDSGVFSEVIVHFRPKNSGREDFEPA